MLEESLRQQPSDGKVIFVDLNSYFASVEQQHNPKLRGRPIGVCPFISDATCVIAASIEAKRYGLKTAMRVPQAKRLCPNLILVEANPPLYREYHRRIMAELDNTRCQVSIKSIDEAMLKVPSDLQNQTQLLVQDIRQRITSVGDQLRCSIGIASNLFLSKMGSNLMKPDGLVEVKLADLENFYSRLSLTDLHGIAWRMARRLRELGIYTPLEFYHAPLSQLKQAFGSGGEAWYLRLRGYEVDTRPTTRRIIGHQMTIVPEPAKTLDEVLSVANQLTYRAAVRLRAASLAARGIAIHLRFSDHTSWQRVYHGRQPFYDSTSFFDQVKRLLASYPPEQSVRLVSVSAIDLIDAHYMPQKLFEPADRSERISQALDAVNWRYGETTLVTGRQLLAGHPRDAIGFGNAAANAQELPK